jgi:VWFA-related protein
MISARVVVGMVAALASYGNGGPQQPTFSARTEVVRVDALVTSNGKPLRGLAVGDFEIFDNGVLQTVDLVSFEQLPLNVALALDVSASLDSEQIQHLRRAGMAVLGALHRLDRAALLTFSDDVSLERPLTGDTASVEAALAGVESSGGTALNDGVYAAVTIADATFGRGLLIVFSDGIDTSSVLTGVKVIDAARRSNVVVYAVSSGRGDRSFLRDIADATGGRLYEVESTGDIQQRFLQVLAEFRERYLLSYTPRGVTREGWHRLEVKVKGRRAAVRARTGYLAVK